MDVQRKGKGLKASGRRVRLGNTHSLRGHLMGAGTRGGRRFSEAISDDSERRREIL